MHTCWVKLLSPHQCDSQRRVNDPTRLQPHTLSVLNVTNYYIIPVIIRWPYARIMFMNIQGKNDIKACLPPELVSKYVMKVANWKESILFLLTFIALKVVIITKSPLKQYPENMLFLVSMLYIKPSLQFQYLSCSAGCWECAELPGRGWWCPNTKQLLQLFPLLGWNVSSPIGYPLGCNRWK